MQKMGKLLFYLVWPALFILLRLSRRTRVLIVHEDRILVMKSWLGDGRWQLPGGGLHRVEKPEQGIVREVKEELGITLSSDELQALGKYRYRDKGLRFTYYAFVIELDEPPGIRRRWWEVADYAWIPRRELTVGNSGSDVRQVLAGWKP